LASTAVASLTASKKEIGGSVPVLRALEGDFSFSFFFLSFFFLSFFLFFFPLF